MYFEAKVKLIYRYKIINIKIKAKLDTKKLITRIAVFC